jgi:hypothetical protein
MPPGLRSQILVAILITAAALLLPTALSASGGVDPAPRQAATDVSAGSIATTTHAFEAGDFAASAFSDWEH